MIKNRIKSGQIRERNMRSNMRGLSSVVVLARAFGASAAPAMGHARGLASATRRACSLRDLGAREVAWLRAAALLRPSLTAMPKMQHVRGMSGMVDVEGDRPALQITERCAKVAAPAALFPPPIFSASLCPFLGVSPFETPPRVSPCPYDVGEGMRQRTRQPDPPLAPPPPLPRCPPLPSSPPSSPTSLPFFPTPTHSSDALLTPLMPCSPFPTPSRCSIPPSTLSHPQRILKVNPDGRVLRLRVDGGGCSGFQYKFELDAQAQGEDLSFTNVTPHPKP